MIENRLTLARLDSQPAQFQFESIELREMVELSWRGCQDKAAARKPTFENAVPDDLFCSADRNALAIVFVNLLENAVEYANDSGRIEVAARKSDGVVEIEVTNTGCQLTEEQVPHVFDRFWRADPSRKDASLHVGLGLALVHRIITALGGKVVAGASNGEFTISIRLPIMPCQVGVA